MGTPKIWENSLKILEEFPGLLGGIPIQNTSGWLKKQAHLAVGKILIITVLLDLSDQYFRLY